MCRWIQWHGKVKQASHAAISELTCMRGLNISLLVHLKSGFIRVKDWKCKDDISITQKAGNPRGHWN